MRCRAQLIGWLTAHGDPQAEGGRLKPILHTYNLAEGRAANGWNNRGRH
jgi:hypothetical protein